MSSESEDSSAEAQEGVLEPIAVDRDAEVPIGVQLAWALRSRIGEGRLVPGQRLPGLRELAEASGVNVNTVRAVYQRLEQERLIESHQGSGTFVAATPQQLSPVGAIAAGAAREAAQTGVDPREVAAALYVASTPSAGEDEAVERRRLLRTQITALERTLGEMEAAHPGLAPPPAAKRASIGPALLSAAELEHVRASLVRRLTVLQANIDGEHDSSQQSGASSPAAAEQAQASSPKRTAPRPRPRPAAAGT